MTNQLALILRTTLLLLMMMYSTDARMSIITKKQDFPVGEDILLLCKIGVEDGDITWYKDGEEIDADMEKVTIEKVDESSSKMVIKKATMQDTGKYTCHCEYDSGHKDDIQTQLYVYEGPSFSNTPTYHEFLEGTTGVVPCLVTGKPALDVHWMRGNQEIPSNEGKRVHQSHNTLYIKNVKMEDAGTYVCYAQIRGREIKQKVSVSIVVNAPPTAQLKELMKKVLAGPETNVSLVCLVTGHPKPNINWTMPVTTDHSRHYFNSDSSELTIRSVTRTDYGEYVCTATNKIAESSSTLMLNIFEAPEVFLSAERQSVSVSEQISVACNVSGHPQPELHWINKHNGQTLDSPSGRVHVTDGVLVIEEVVPSDGGLYSCMAVSPSGNASRDVAIHTQPGPPQYLTVSSGETSVRFSLKTPPNSGGTAITSYVLQWMQGAAQQWKEITVPASGPLVIPNLRQYTSYTVRLAALNAVGVGEFSDTKTIRTQGMREPDSPVLSADQMQVERNTLSIPLKQVNDGGTPLQVFKIQYKEHKEGAEWKKVQLSSNAGSIYLENLAFGSSYQLEVRAFNANGSSIPATLNFTTGERPVSNRITKGSVVGIVMVIFLVVFLVVDATCCYRNRCGLLMTIGVKLFGHNVPGMKMFEEGDGTTNGEVKLKGLSTPKRQHAKFVHKGGWTPLRGHL
ncbi:Neural cell adhesion molecule 1 [Collichthys lucidus]|uniref:Neural cell adhesion molecule 1 n=1 Tax=Collichthys lucidus TaxID=240159 RepID=A0A4U5V227_COLLU|nr:Neural cell adhesion molecule 1 [Collichthys lucidus]